jgi:hypothetical protein
MRAHRLLDGHDSGAAPGRVGLHVRAPAGARGQPPAQPSDPAHLTLSSRTT